MRVLADVRGIDRSFDYLVPEDLAGDVRIGTVVRVDLHGRRVRAWVIDDDVEPPAGVRLKPIAKVTGWGPSEAVISLSAWAAWRWAGPRSALLGTATHERSVVTLPTTTTTIRDRARAVSATDPGASPMGAVLTDAFAGGVASLRLAPTADLYPVVHAAASRGPALVIAPSIDLAGALGARLSRAGIAAAVLPRGWPNARGGGVTVIGARAAAWAPCEGLASVVVLDEHDEVHQEERTPTWHARDVAIERAARAGVPCVLVSPCPTLEALSTSRVVAAPRPMERAGWAITDVVDQSVEDPTKGLLGERLVEHVREGRRVVCIVNRTGRARLVACAGCGRIGTCEHCDAAVVAPEVGVLSCGRCGTTRPPLCLHCGRTKFKLLRRGVSRLREELEVLAGEPVQEISGPVRADEPARRVVVGTEAALHRVRRADVVAFLDFDQELLAPRYRAGEEALALIVRATRLVGGRGDPDSGRILLQTRTPGHEVVRAAVLGDPERVSAAEAERRDQLRFPPRAALAEVSGQAAEAFVEVLSSAGHLGVELLGPADGRWLVRAPDHQTLCDALGSVPRPPGRLRVAVDPPRV